MKNFLVLFLLLLPLSTFAQTPAEIWAAFSNNPNPTAEEIQAAQSALRDMQLQAVQDGLGYHVTDASNIPGILENGLQPGFNGSGFPQTWFSVDKPVYNLGAGDALIVVPTNNLLDIGGVPKYTDGGIQAVTKPCVVCSETISPEFLQNNATVYTVTDNGATVVQYPTVAPTVTLGGESVVNIATSSAPTFGLTPGGAVLGGVFEGGNVAANVGELAVTSFTNPMTYVTGGATIVAQLGILNFLNPGPDPVYTPDQLYQQVAAVTYGALSGPWAINHPVDNSPYSVPDGNGGNLIYNPQSNPTVSVQIGDNIYPVPSYLPPNGNISTYADGTKIGYDASGNVTSVNGAQVDPNTMQIVGTGSDGKSYPIINTPPPDLAGNGAPGTLNVATDGGASSTTSLTSPITPTYAPAETTQDTTPGAVVDGGPVNQVATIPSTLPSQLDPTVTTNSNGDPIVVDPSAGGSVTVTASAGDPSASGPSSDPSTTVTNSNGDPSTGGSVTVTTSAGDPSASDPSAAAPNSNGDSIVVDPSAGGSVTVTASAGDPSASDPSITATNGNSDSSNTTTGNETGSVGDSSSSSSSNASSDNNTVVTVSGDPGLTASSDSGYNNNQGNTDSGYSGDMTSSSQDYYYANTGMTVAQYDDMLASQAASQYGNDAEAYYGYCDFYVDMSCP